MSDDEKDIRELRQDPQNPRQHNERNLKVIGESLLEIGPARSIVIDENDQILAGNGVVRAAQAAGFNKVKVVDADGETLIAVRRTNLTPQQKKRLAVFDNQSGALAEWDAEILAALREEDPDIVKSLFEKKEWAEIMQSLNKGPQGDDPGEAMDESEALRQKWGVEIGQVWRLGQHLLICGDCTDAGVVEQVMHGQTAALAPVDPPYNVGFDYDSAGTVDDDKGSSEYEEFTKAWFSVCQSVSLRQIVTPGCNNLALWLRWFDPYHWAPWTKSNSMTNGKVSRFWCWEPILFFGESWPRRRSNDIFEYPIGEQGGVANHPCPKPLKMWQDLLENYSEPGDIIFESFAGSGTTIIASEQLGRECRAVEISPAYCAIVLERWSKMTSQQPFVIGD